MRKLFLGMDLAICSLWTIAALGGRMVWVESPAIWMVMLLIMLRILLSFTLYNREKKTWIPGLLFLGLTAFAVSTDFDIKIRELISKVFPLLNIDFDRGGVCRTACGNHSLVVDNPRGSLSCQRIP